MRANRVPVIERLRNRIAKLEYRAEAAHVPSDSSGNPYYMCSYCRIHDPQVSINNGRHYTGCPMQGIQREIQYYKQLLSFTVAPVVPAPVENSNGKSQEEVPGA